MLLFFFFNDTATTEIYTLSLHDALPISALLDRHGQPGAGRGARADLSGFDREGDAVHRSEEHTSELQSPCNLVCRLLLEKKNIKAHHCSEAVTYKECRPPVKQLFECALT